MVDKRKQQPEPTPTDLGIWMLKVRLRLKMTREQFQEAIGAGDGTVVKWESGERKTIRDETVRGKLFEIAPADLRRECPPAVSMPSMDGAGVARDSTDTGAYSKMSDPPGIVASIKSRLEGALDQRAEQFEGKQLLFIQREIELLAPRLAGSTLTDEALAAYVDGLARFARKFGGGDRG